VPVQPAEAAPQPAADAAAPTPAGEPAPAPVTEPAPSPPVTPAATQPAPVTLKGEATGAASVEVISVEAGEAPAVPWSVGLTWAQGYNAAGFDKGGEQTFNPEYAWGFSLDAGWTFTEIDLSVEASQGLDVELTDSDSTVTRQELQLTDTALTVAKAFKLELNDDTKLGITPSLTVGLPVSKASQAASVIVTTTGAVAATYSYSPVLEGLSLKTRFSYGRRWATSNTVQAAEPFPCDPAGADPAQDCVHLGGSSTTRDSFVLAVGAGITLVPDLTAGLELSFGWNLAYDLAPTEFTSLTGATFRYEDESFTHWRNSRVLRVTLDYGWTKWLSTTLFMRNAMPDLGPDGQRRAPFEPLDVVVGLSVSFSFDQAYLATQPDPTAPQ